MSWDAGGTVSLVLEPRASHFWDCAGRHAWHRRAIGRFRPLARSSGGL